MKEELLNTKKAKEILAARKAIIAEKKLDFMTLENSSILIFSVDKTQKYALPYEQIERVIPFQTVTYIPGSDPVFLGVLYYNTEVWPVISCNRLFKIQGEELSSFFILCKKETHNLALSVNEVLGQANINIKEYEELTHFANEQSSKTSYIRGVYRTDIAIIELKAIFDKWMH